MTREVVWHPDLMMIRANELRRLVEHLDDADMSGQSDGSTVRRNVCSGPDPTVPRRRDRFESMAM